MEEQTKRRRHRKHRSKGNRKQKFWVRLILYFIYFSAIFIVFYYFFDRDDMMKELKKDPDILAWKIFGPSLVFALGFTLWMRRDPKLTEK